MSFNSFSGIVRVVTDIETKTVGKQSVTKCRVVHKYSYRDNSDIFMTLNFWGNKGGAAEKIVRKGDSLFVKGGLLFNEYEGKTYVDLKVDDFSRINNTPSSDSTSGGDKKKTKTKSAGTSVEPVDVNIEEEIPF